MLKVLHVAGAVLLLGNVVVTGLWSALLFARRDSLPFRPVARAILWADLVFTVGGGTLLTVSGILLAIRGGYVVSETPWLLRGILLLGGATIIWLGILLPAQLRMERLADAGGPALRRVFVRWNAFGWVSTGLLFWGLWSMVVRR